MGEAALDILISFARSAAVMWTLITRIPLWYQPNTLELSASALTVIPLAGGLFAAVAALPAWLLSFALSPGVCAWIASGVYTALGWGLHLDGWGDMCDGIGSGRHGEEMRAIMKDPHSGTYGVAGVVLAISIRASLLSSVEPGRWIAVCAVAGGVGRLACAAAAYAGRYPWSEGMARGIVIDFHLRHLLYAILASCPFLVLAPAGTVVGAALSCAAGAGLALWSNRRMGGTNGDIIGAAAVLGEIFTLAILAL
jgi:adenosylcobinamide-GDP ribazoletransferase